MTRTQALKQLIEGIQQEATDIEYESGMVAMDLETAQESIGQLRLRLENILKACEEALQEVRE